MREAWVRFWSHRQPITRAKLVHAYISLSGASGLVVIPTMFLAGEHGLLAIIFGIFVSLVLGVLLFPFALPLIWMGHFIAFHEFPFLRCNYLFALLGGLVLAVVLMVDDFGRFPYLAASVQTIVLAATLIFVWLGPKEAATDDRTRFAKAKEAPQADAALALAIIAAVVVATPLLVWRPGARFLKTDACLDAGGRMPSNGVCEYGLGGPN